MSGYILAKPCNRNLQTSKETLESQAHGTSLFTSAASNQRDCPNDSPWDAQGLCKLTADSLSECRYCWNRPITTAHIVVHTFPKSIILRTLSNFYDFECRM